MEGTASGPAADDTGDWDGEVTHVDCFNRSYEACRDNGGSRVYCASRAFVEANLGC